MSPPVRRRLELQALGDDLLEEILLRVASPADLARASAACAAFRRLVTDPAFLRRYRSLHPPLLAMLPQGFDPVEAPHPNAPASRALARAAGFSFDYLPPGRWDRWNPCSVRDGRALLKGIPRYLHGFACPDFVVCDPLSRRYVLLPAIPCDEPEVWNIDAFLVPSGDWEQTSLRVVGVMNCMTKLTVFNFSSISGCWSAAASASLDALKLDRAPYTLPRSEYAYGCFYWMLSWLNKLLKLDINKMELSTVDLPPQQNQARSIAIVEAGEGRLGLFSYNMHETYVYYLTLLLNETERTSNWQMTNRIPLLACYKGYYILGAAEGYIFLIDSQELQVMEAYYALEIKTSEIKRVCTMRSSIRNLCPYFGFPPSMSPRRI